MLLAFCKIVVQSCIQLHRWKDYALSGVGFLLFAGAILVCVYSPFAISFRSFVNF